MTPGFWSGRSVFLTGHTGFKGSWLALWLQHLGARVTGYALPAPTTPSLFEGARVAQGMASTIADIRDLQSVQSALAKAESEIVIHMAAQSLVRPSYADPLDTFTSNVMGTANVLEAMRHVPAVRASVIVTSDKCYENRNLDRGYVEDDPLGGYDPYSSSKACAEIVTAAYRRSFFGAPPAHGAAIASARAGNVIGGGDWAKDRLIPDMVLAFGKGEPVQLRHPAATRPWQHVLDPLAGYLTLAEILHEEGKNFAEAWNFGPDAREVMRVDALATAVAREWGGGVSWKVDPGAHPHEAAALALDAAKARDRLAWRPRLALPRAVEWTVDWYKRQQAGGDAREMTLRQIAAYMEIPG